ncbi:hydroxycarboxylic acid receptor 2-like [Centropristis striata]|uniref:hydroxycarboxylic acid receptor 2-like n=1 Tax=Centropristis striata TaxID=184440 RepID=UPI0027E15287|nr:hydroxycarboxylic acid receptor 2-like [Centropristis striata]
MYLVNGTSATNGTNILHCLSTYNFGNVFLSIFTITVMLVGLPGNIVALWIFCFRMKCWKPNTVFLFNLVLADFFLLISVPFRIDLYLQDNYWRFGPVWCRINLFMLAVNRSASIGFMTVVALDRYFKVVHPLHWISRMTLTQAGWLTGLIWMAVVALRIPLLATNLHYQDENVSLCRSFNSYEVIPPTIVVHYVAFVLEFFLPWFMLLFCSARIVCILRQRGMDKKKNVRRAIRAVGVISSVFTICFMPNIVTGLGAVYIKYFYPNDCLYYTLLTEIFMVCIGFTYLNSALDPLIYVFSSAMYRDALMAAISQLGFVRKYVRAAGNRETK